MKNRETIFDHIVPLSYKYSDAVFYFGTHNTLPGHFIIVEPSILYHSDQFQKDQYVITSYIKQYSDQIQLSFYDASYLADITFSYEIANGEVIAINDEKVFLNFLFTKIQRKWPGSEIMQLTLTAVSNFCCVIFPNTDQPWFLLVDRCAGSHFISIECIEAIDLEDIERIKTNQPGSFIHDPGNVFQIFTIDLSQNLCSGNYQVFFHHAAGSYHPAWERLSIHELTAQIEYAIKDNFDMESNKNGLDRWLGHLLSEDK